MIDKIKHYFMTDPGQPEEQNRARTMRLLLLLLLLALCIVLIVNLHWKQFGLEIAILVAIFILAVSWLLLERGHFQISFLMTVLAMLGVAAYGGISGWGLHDIVIIMFPGIVIISSLVLERRLILLVAALSIIVVGIIGQAERMAWIPRNPIIPGDLGDFIVVALVILITSLWVIVITDQSRRRLDQMHHNALHDYLTGLPNRVLLNDRIQQIIHLQQRRPELRYAILFIDLDNFKGVNDSLGHHQGDELIKAAGQRIQKVLRSVDTVARVGGDEYILLLPEISSVKDAALVADRVQVEIMQPFNLPGGRVNISASIGIVFGEGYQSVDDLLIDADLAMYRAKALGRARYEVFEATMRQVKINLSS